MKRSVFFLIIFFSFFSAEAQRSNFDAPADSTSWLIKAYTDSINAYRMRIDSLQNANAGISEASSSHIDFTRLFLPLTFYSNITGRKFLLAGRDDASLFPLRDYVDDVLMSIYLHRPDLVSELDRHIEKAGPIITEAPVKIDNKPKIADKVAPVVEKSDVEVVPVVVKRPNFWTFKGDLNLQINQNYVSGNWYQGGESNYSMIGRTTLRANYNNKQKVKWDNTLEARLGLATSKGDTIHSLKATENLLRLTSNFGLQATKKWYYTVELEASTQIVKGYRVNNPNCYTAIFAPLNAKLSLGMDYNISWFKNKLTGKVHLAPLTYSLRYCSRSELVKSYGIEEGKHIFDDYGSSFRIEARWTPVTNFYWNVRLTGFTSYKRAELAMENTFHFQFSKYISCDLFIYPRFDDSRVRDEHHAYWQFKEYMSFGLSYSF